jgi:hypothetical protein
MRTVTPRQHELLERLVRRIDRKISYEATVREDGGLDVKLSLNRLSTKTQIDADTLEASGEDVLRFEALRSKVKRIFDRLKMPAPPPKIPKVVIQKEAASFGFRPQFRGRR